MPGVEDVLNFESQAKETAKQLIKGADLIFCLDFSSLSRLKEMEEPVKSSTALKVLVDHHQQPEEFATYVFWNESASSTCELIFRMIERLGMKEMIQLDAATCLYTGILTDTGSFRFDSTGPEVHRIAGELIAKGVRPNKVNRDLFDTNSFDRLRLLGYVLTNKLVYLPEYRVAYMKITENELKQYNSKNGETEGIVNYGLSISDVVMSVIFIEKDHMIKISFRSVDDFSVSELARDHFTGGGHHNAAGGKSELGLEETEQKFLNLLPLYKNKLLSQPKS
jgi:phosphoesterase RecJ-like protein